LERRGIAPDEVNGYDREEYTHLAVAAAIASGSADCGMGIRNAAIALELDFIPVTFERYDLVIPERFWDLPMIQYVIALLRDDEFQAALGLGGCVRQWLVLFHGVEPFCRKAYYFAVVVDTNVLGVACDAHLPGGRIDDFVTKRHPATLEFFDPAFCRNALGVARWRNITGMNFGNGQPVPAAFKFGIIGSYDAGIVAAGLFKVDNVIGVVGNSHRIGFSVSNVKHRFRHESIVWSHANLLWHGSGIG